MTDLKRCSFACQSNPAGAMAIATADFSNMLVHISNPKNEPLTCNLRLNS